MTHLNEYETIVLRDALGLSYWNRQESQRNLVFKDGKNGVAIDGLVRRGFLTDSSVIGQGGVEIYYKATDAGRVAVLDARWPD